MYPIGDFHSKGIALFEKNNIGSDTVRVLECSCRHTHRTKQVAALRKISSSGFVELIHSELACYKCDYTTGLYLIHGFCRKVVMYLEAELVISLIADTVISERDISDNHIKAVVIEPRLLKALDLYAIFGVQHLCYPARNAVKLHTVKFGMFVHFFRHLREKVSDTHRRFKNISVLEAELSESLIYAVRNLRRCIEARKR